MGGFPIDFVYNGAVHLREYIDIRKWEVTYFFYFRGEMNFVLNPIEVN